MKTATSHNGWHQLWFYVKNYANSPLPAFTGRVIEVAPELWSYGLVEKEKKWITGLLQAIEYLKGKGLTGAGVIGVYHARRVAPLMLRVCSLADMVPGAPTEGSVLATGVLADTEIGQQVREALDDKDADYPVPGGGRRGGGGGGVYSGPPAGCAHHPGAAPPTCRGGQAEWTACPGPDPCRPPGLRSAAGAEEGATSVVHLHEASRDPAGGERWCRRGDRGAYREGGLCGGNWRKGAAARHKAGSDPCCAFYLRGRPCGTGRCPWGGGAYGSDGDGGDGGGGDGGSCPTDHDGDGGGGGEGKVHPRGRDGDNSGGGGGDTCPGGRDGGGGGRDACSDGRDGGNNGGGGGDTYPDGRDGGGDACPSGCDGGRDGGGNGNARSDSRNRDGGGGG
uniref:Uncharacterized protein n=1 Tax=Setaria viridis TaxID=4556 RepID=A0A4V6D153_SETVI|nr:hypothetical protein SEVIR_9G218900v2 [Setaria viridis]